MRLWTWAALGAALFSGTAYAAPLYGDANGDGIVNIQDAILLSKISGGLAPITDAARRNGDVAPVNNAAIGSFGDGKLTMLDAERVLRKVNGLESTDFPARPSFYILEIGNSFTYRKYNASGPTTGPGTTNPDVTHTIVSQQTDTLTSGPYPVFVITGSEGSEEHVGYTADGQGILVTQGQLGGSTSTFDPPIVVLKAPVQAGTTWSGSTATTISGFGVIAAYTGKIEAAGPIDVPAGAATMHFDNALKVTVSYNAPTSLGAATGEEYYWFVPYLGPVQHGYTRTLPFVGTKAVNPDLSLVAANVHGVLYP